MNLDRSRTAADIEGPGRLGRGVNVLRPYMKNVAKVVSGAAR